MHVVIRGWCCLLRNANSANKLSRHPSSNHHPPLDAMEEDIIELSSNDCPSGPSQPVRKRASNQGSLLAPKRRNKSGPRVNKSTSIIELADDSDCSLCHPQQSPSRLNHPAAMLSWRLLNDQRIFMLSTSLTSSVPLRRIPLSELRPSSTNTSPTLHTVVQPSTRIIFGGRKPPRISVTAF